MTRSAANGEQACLAALVGAADFSSCAIHSLTRVARANTAEEMLLAFEGAVAALGAESGVFMSFLRDDATLASYRTLLACDPAWMTEYARHGWFADDPWLRHALHDTEPIRSGELVAQSAREQMFVDAAASLGFASAIIVAAPSSRGPSRAGVLCLGSSTPGYFDDGGYDVVRILARSLAMELHAWMRRSIRQELLIKSRLTADDIELLKHEADGHGSKFIATTLGTEAKTIDCRFQRVCTKLDAPNRRAAVRLARLYGLI